MLVGVKAIKENIKEEFIQHVIIIKLSDQYKHKEAYIKLLYRSLPNDLRWDDEIREKVLKNINLNRTVEAI